MMLPGQSRQFSKRLQYAVAEVEFGLGRNIVFLPLAGLPDPLLVKRCGDTTKAGKGQLNCWMPSFAAAEATAAELGACHAAERRLYTSIEYQYRA